MAVRVQRGAGVVVISIGGCRDELTPTEARAVARRLMEAVRDVERQRPTSGDGWEMGELY
ncbi:hypothetical protein [Kitasatospora sp. NPDC050543]|uniref:hypothetical protein n=1 Tax=Kitasatospora sp. NPDC050543 TaxID=3364054 RepID=UPI003799661A